ncbi:MAG: hypothetical protein QXQ31_06385 [Zestosphaera sp.]
MRVSKDSLRYLYLFKAETGRPLYVILDTVIRYCYEKEEVRREIVKELSRDTEVSQLEIP